MSIKLNDKTHKSMNKTYINNKNIKAKWFFIDAKNKTLGRLSAKIAKTLRGKNSIDYIPYKINNSKVIVINAEHVKVSGQKRYQKVYRKHSGRPGGLKQEYFHHLQQRIPCRIIEKSVKGMLPKNALGRELFSNLKVYSGPSHPHKAQQPTALLVK